MRIARLKEIFFIIYKREEFVNRKVSPFAAFSFSPFAAFRRSPFASKIRLYAKKAELIGRYSYQKNIGETDVNL